MPPADSGVDKQVEGVFDIRIAPSDSNIMYMVLAGRVYKTIDGGTTWARTNFTQLPHSSTSDTLIANAVNDRYYGGKMAVDPNDPDKVFLGTRSNGLFYTSDGGSTWKSVTGVPAGTQPGILGICFQDSNVIYAGSWGSGVYRTSNGGTSWTRISDGSGGRPTHVLHSACNNGKYYAMEFTGNYGNLWRYSGTTWTQVYGGNRGHSVAGDPNVPDRIVIGTDYGDVFVSTNAGDSWNNTSFYWPKRVSSDVPWHLWADGATQYMANGDMMFDPATPGLLLFAEGLGVWKEDLSGTPPVPASWEGMSKGIEQLVVNAIVSPPGESTFNVCVWDRGTFAMTDPDVYPSRHGPIQTFNACWGLAYVDTDATNPKLVQANYWTSDNSAYSTDQGTSWTQFGADFGSSYGGSIAASTDSNFLAYRGGNSGAYYTTNGGNSWTKITGYFGDNISNSPFLNRHVITADHVTPNEFWLYYVNAQSSGDSKQGLWRTTNGGSSWTKVHAGFLTQWGLDAWNGTLRSVPGKGGHLFWSTGGSNNDGVPNSAAPFMRSTDGGVTWTDVNPNVREVYAFGFGDTFGSYPRIYIAGWVNNVWGIHYSDDAGASWTKIGDYPLGSFDTITSVEGAKDGTERVYVGYRGSGAVYGTPSTTSPTGTKLVPPQAPILLP